MSTLRVNLVLKDKILVSRESARLLEDALGTIIQREQPAGQPAASSTVTVDFAGIQGIAPSFLDELLTVFESFIGSDLNGSHRSLIVAHPPTRLSTKFEAVARGHGLSVQAMPDGSWLLTPSRHARL
jgi:hypothetical protein